ncbi:MAG: hypothetical protein K2O18_14375 [Oscillospiraceae bacterium]|nr:hypothetical protein [Oscillospiraceae bacterium]
MVAFNEASTRRVLSPWGAEVKKRLIDRSLKQDDLVSMLRYQGYSVDKAALSNLLYGIGVSNRQPEIESISELLDIPYSKQTRPGT